MKRILTLFALLFTVALTVSAQHTMWYVEGRGIATQDAFGLSERSYRIEGYLKNPISETISLTAYGRVSRENWGNPLPNAGFVGASVRPSTWVGVEGQIGIQEYSPVSSFWRLRSTLFLGTTGEYIYTKSMLIVTSVEYGNGTGIWFQSIALIPVTSWFAPGVYAESKYGVGPRIDFKFLPTPLRVYGAVLLREFGNNTFSKRNMTGMIGIRATM
ncbi:MAG: hypothetical protein WCW78_02205 [Candidatus Paceibacterota bacterium]|jgi:hypothetical protein